MSSLIFSFTILSDEGIQLVNKQWFGKNNPTDVISFSMLEELNQKSKIKDKKEKTIELKSSKAGKQVSNKVADRDAIKSIPKMAGEIIINEDEVRRNAREYNVSFEQEMARVVAHGVLHVYGYEDDTDKKRQAMKAIEDIVVQEFETQ